MFNICRKSLNEDYLQSQPILLQSITYQNISSEVTGLKSLHQQTLFFIFKFSLYHFRDISRFYFLWTTYRSTDVNRVQRQKRVEHVQGTLKHRYSSSQAYISWNNTPLEQNPNAEPGIQPEISWSVGIDIATEPSGRT